MYLFHFFLLIMQVNQRYVNNKFLKLLFLNFLQNFRDSCRPSVVGYRVSLPLNLQVVIAPNLIEAPYFTKSSAPIAIIDCSLFSITKKFNNNMQGFYTCLIVIGRFMPPSTGSLLLAVKNRQSISLMSVSHVF